MKARFWGWSILALIGFGAGAIGAAFALGFQDFSGFLWEVPVYALAAAICAAAGLALAIQRSRRPRLNALSVAAAATLWVIFILALFNIQVSFPLDHWYQHGLNALLALISIFGMWAAAALPLFAFEPSTALLRRFRRAALLLCTLLAVAWLGYYVDDTYLSGSDKFIRVALMFSSVASLVSVLCLVGGLYVVPASAPQPIQISKAFCPRCGSVCDSIEMGHCTCAQCHLPIELDRREPRCACGYLLMNLNGTTCPECGKPFRARIRYELTSV